MIEWCERGVSIHRYATTLAPNSKSIQFSSLGTTYRGRVLLSMRVERHPPAKMGHCIMTKDMKYSLPTELIPATQKCTLRVAAFQGSDIPMFRLPTGVTKMRIQICLGSHKMTFKYRKNHKGVVEWNQVPLSIPTQR